MEARACVTSYVRINSVNNGLRTKSTHPLSLASICQIEDVTGDEGGRLGTQA